MAIKFLELLLSEILGDMCKDLQEFLILAPSVSHLITQLSEMLGIDLKKQPSDQSSHILFFDFEGLLGNVEEVEQPLKENHGYSR